MRNLLILILFLFCRLTFAQKYTDKVNVFLGTSGDHGQLSPAASSPFSMLSIGPQTYPHLHAGYEYKANIFLGFTHTRMEGVGCRGNGGNILLTPFIKSHPTLIKVNDKGEPGYYKVDFNNKIEVEVTTSNNHGIYHFRYPELGSLLLDISFAFVEGFIDAEYIIQGRVLKGEVISKTTCGSGKYKIYFAFEFPYNSKIIERSKNKIEIQVPIKDFKVNVGLSSVGEQYAVEKIIDMPFDCLKETSSLEWEKLLSKIKVKGTNSDEDLFYSLLYRTLQSPFNITEADGSYKAIDGSIQKTNDTIYNGFAIWDNYRELFPLLSLFFVEKYVSITKSIANLYRFGKKQWATELEPSPTVRNEHAVIVLLDAKNKGVELPIKEIKDSIIREIDSLDYATPDKALEANYDYWAASQLLQKIDEVTASRFKKKALNYQYLWNREFKDINKVDADKMQARGLYQGTIWQYRWLVPYDIQGLISLFGDEACFIKELDLFFNKSYYNHANETDLQVPSLYNATKQPWKSQRLIRQLLKEDVIQYYFNNNSRGVDPYIGRIYKNQPDAYLRTMDDDAGTMSSWWILRSLGFSAVNVGEPKFYITTPLFDSYEISLPDGKIFKVEIINQSKNSHYIKKIELNNSIFYRNWIEYEEIMKGGVMKFTLDTIPNKLFGRNKIYQTKL